jgi:pimeloyl-ACP methyl ester carboxylesterase
MLCGARHPGHVAALVLQSTSARFDLARAVEGFRRVGGDAVAELARREYGDDPVSDDEWATVVAAFGPEVPGPEELARRLRNPELGKHGMELLRRMEGRPRALLDAARRLPDHGMGGRSPGDLGQVEAGSR